MTPLTIYRCVPCQLGRRCKNKIRDKFCKSPLNRLSNNEEQILLLLQTLLFVHENRDDIYLAEYTSNVVLEEEPCVTVARKYGAEYKHEI